jgi:putative copper resistance protein D
MIEAGLVASRFLHFATVMALFGLALFPLYAYPSRVGKAPARLSRWLRVMLRMATPLALLSGIAWGLFTVANMTGALSAAVDPDTLWSVFRETGFGQVWMARLVLIVALLAPIRGLINPGRPEWVTAGISAVVLVSLAGVGHTQVNEGTMRLIHMSADAVHLLAAGAWLGGLLPLAYVLTVGRRSPTPEDTAETSITLLRFSGMGSAAVALLVGSGLINAWFLVGSLSALMGTAYGQLLVTKLCLFAGMLALAALNRFWLVPSLVKAKPFGQPARWLLRLRWHVLGEQVLGLIIVLSVSMLGTMQPAVSASLP